MSKVLVVLGAGSGLGSSVARLFGGKGFRVAVVARRQENLNALVADLTEKGIEAAAFSADLTDTGQIRGLVGAIRDRFGRIDVVEYGPVSRHQPFAPAASLDAATLETLLPLHLLTPVEFFSQVIPEMIERGDGALLMTTGISAVSPMPFLSGPGPVMSAARNYIHSLHGELAQHGIYVGTLSVAAFIDGSEAAGAAAEQVGESGSIGFPYVSPDELAEIYWAMYTSRTAIERVHPASA